MQLKVSVEVERSRISSEKSRAEENITNNRIEGKSICQKRMLIKIDCH